MLLERIVLATPLCSVVVSIRDIPSSEMCFFSLAAEPVEVLGGLLCHGFGWLWLSNYLYLSKMFIYRSRADEVQKICIFTTEHSRDAETIASHVGLRAL